MFAFPVAISSCFGNNNENPLLEKQNKKKHLLGVNAMTIKEDNAEGRIPPGSHNKRLLREKKAAENGAGCVNCEVGKGLIRLLHGKKAPITNKAQTKKASYGCFQM